MDTISNMLSAIKNACMAGKKSLEVPYSKESEAVAKILQESGYLESVKSFKEKGKAFKKLNLTLQYDDDLPRISDVKRISKPGRRVYSGAGLLRRPHGVLVVSTSRGIMNGMDARKKKLGGEVICEVM